MGQSNVFNLNFPAIVRFGDKKFFSRSERKEIVSAGRCAIFSHPIIGNTFKIILFLLENEMVHNFDGPCRGTIFGKKSYWKPHMQFPNQ